MSGSPLGVQRVRGALVLSAALFGCMTTLGLILPNATAAALVPFARQAGTASALLGMLQYALGAAAGAVVGLLHNGTALPMAGTVAGCGVCGALVLAVSERLHDRSRTGHQSAPDRAA